MANASTSERRHRLRVGARLLLLALAGLAAFVRFGPREREPSVFRFHGDKKTGEVCRAQSECGFQQQCVYRGTLSLSEPPVVESGVCARLEWPAGCFGTLPVYPMTKAEREKLREEGQKGLPIHIICH